MTPTPPPPPPPPPSWPVCWLPVAPLLPGKLPLAPNPPSPPLPPVTAALATAAGRVRRVGFATVAAVGDIRAFATTTTIREALAQRVHGVDRVEDDHPTRAATTTSSAKCAMAATAARGVDGSGDRDRCLGDQ